MSKFTKLKTTKTFSIKHDYNTKTHWTSSRETYKLKLIFTSIMKKKKSRTKAVMH